MLHITNLHVSVANTPIINNFNLIIGLGELHALMGPNGSGKSTLAYAIIGYPGFECLEGEIIFNGQNVKNLSLQERAQLGIFLSFQNPPVIPGVKVRTFLQEIYYARFGAIESVDQFEKTISEYLPFIGLTEDFLDRAVNDGFSGGEKKKFELLQLLLLEPQFVILDEIDAGLDIDALKVIGNVIHYLRTKNPLTSFLIITHYPHLFRIIEPNKVHIIKKGLLVDSADNRLIDKIQQKGYGEY